MYSFACLTTCVFYLSLLMKLFILVSILDYYSVLMLLNAVRVFRSMSVVGISFSLLIFLNFYLTLMHSRSQPQQQIRAGTGESIQLSCSSEMAERMIGQQQLMGAYAVLRAMIASLMMWRWVLQPTMMILYSLIAKQSRRVRSKIGRQWRVLSLMRIEQSEIDFKYQSVCISIQSFKICCFEKQYFLCPCSPAWICYSKVCNKIKNIHFKTRYQQKAKLSSGSVKCI